jgi:hypothetical protein
MAAAAITPRASDTAFIPASLPALIFTMPAPENIRRGPSESYTG